MADKKEKPSMSELIRDAMKKHPKASPAEIVQSLHSAGHTEIKVGLVYQVKQGKGKKKAKAKRGPAPKAAPSSNGKATFGAAIATVRKAADAVGGYENLLEIANALKG
jgi:hypothetical protein